MVHPTGPSHVWNKPGLSPAMRIPYTHALHTLPQSTVGRFCAVAAPVPKLTTKKYVIVNDVIGMDQKVVIINLVKDKERAILYIL